jgi:hypothetical protein
LEVAVSIAMEYPALTGAVVTQAHADYCAAHGHATHTVGEDVSPWCPRCGSNLSTPTTEIGHNTMFKYIVRDRITGKQVENPYAIYPLAPTSRTTAIRLLESIRHYQGTDFYIEEVPEANN